MEITAIIVGGLVLISLGGMILDYVTKAQAARNLAKPEELKLLAERIAVLEAKIAEQDAKTLVLEDSVRFTSQLLEKQVR